MGYDINEIIDPWAPRLSEVRKRIKEIIQGVHCIAVPILNHAGRPVGAISIAGTTPKTDGERLDAMVSRLKSAGEYVSRRLGFTERANGRGALPAERAAEPPGTETR